MIKRLGAADVCVVEPADGPVDGRRLRDLVMEAHAGGAAMLAIAVEALEPAFFDLRTGVAGDMLQAAVTYRMRLAVVGTLPEPAASSTAFAALVTESNRGTHHRFAGTWQELEEDLRGPAS